MPVFWYVAGILTTLAALIMILPWLRSMPRLTAAPIAPWQASVAAAAIAAVVLGLYRWIGHPAEGPMPPAPLAASDSAFGNAAKVFSQATGDSGAAAAPPAKAGASSMDSAVANLEARLSKGGGSADDWELLAKSFEFLGRPADAAKARAHQLPPQGTAATGSDSAATGTASLPGASGGATGRAVSGEVTLAPTLSAKASPGETLFIVAKSVDTPGIPVAVLRSSVGGWPLKFTLDDSQSMMPGRNLSSAGRVTVEARISRKGQPLPAAGDLQGSSGVIDPADRRPLKILIDHIVT